MAGCWKRTLVKDCYSLVQTLFFLTALSERGEKKDTAPFMFPGLCVIILLELHNWFTFCGHFRLLKLFNIKNIFFPKIHWVLSVKSHLSPVKIFPSTAFLYKALITQFAESALETLRSEAWRIFFSFKWRERKEKEDIEERRSSLSKIFIVMSTWLHLLWAYREKKKKRGAKRKRRKKKGRKSWERKGEIKGKQSFILSLGSSRL